MSDDIVKCADDDPKRCQGINAHGQCPYFQMEGSLYCKMHGGNKGNAQMQKKQLHDYIIQQYQNRLDSFAGSNNIKNLHGEVGILRMTLENILLQIKEPNHFPLYSDKIGNLCDKVHKLVVDIQKIDEKTGQMMNKDMIFTIVDAIITIIGSHVKDADVLLVLSNEISDAIVAIGSGTTIQKRIES
jgi:hypothetical protein